MKKSFLILLLLLSTHSNAGVTEKQVELELVRMYSDAAFLIARDHAIKAREKQVGMTCKEAFSILKKSIPKNVQGDSFTDCAFLLLQNKRITLEQQKACGLMVDTTMSDGTCA